MLYTASSFVYILCSLCSQTLQLAASAAVLDAGYNLDCFNPPNQGVNWRDKSAWPCAKTVRQHPQEAANSALASHVEVSCAEHMHTLRHLMHTLTHSVPTPTEHWQITCPFIIEVIEWKGRSCPLCCIVTMSTICDDAVWELVKAIGICCAHANVNLHSTVCIAYTLVTASAQQRSQTQCMLNNLMCWAVA